MFPYISVIFSARKVLPFFQTFAVNVVNYLTAAKNPRSNFTGSYNRTKNDLPLNSC